MKNRSDVRMFEKMVLTTETVSLILEKRKK